MDQRIIDRYWSKTVVKDGCWDWKGTPRKGYGIFGIRLDGTLKTYSAHRVSYEIHNGPFDPNLFVLHTCDSPPCTNPDHLFIGSHQENMDDMYAKGRRDRKQPYQKKEFRKVRKLSPAQVVEIQKALLKPWWGQNNKLAKEYGVSHVVISLIKHGKYSHCVPVSSLK